jgi:hypothetical protein
MPRSRGLVVLATALPFVLGAFVPVRAYAQAWLPPRGEGSLSASFQRTNADGHFLDDGIKSPGYSTRASNAVLQGTYGITDRLALDLALPFVGVTYLGPEEPLNLPYNVLDDGSYHGSITDLTVAVRYNLLQRPLAVTPFAAALIPTHAYPTIGEAAPGRHFQEYHLGANVGRLLDPLLPRAYVQASYAYAFVRQDVGVPVDYSSFGVEAGYFLTPRIPVSFFWRRYVTHGGLNFAELFEAPPEIFVNLDRVVAVSYHHLGVGLSVPLGSSFSAYGNYVWFASGVDAHFGSGFSAGVTWSFRTGRAAEPPVLFPPPDNGTSSGDLGKTQ